MLRNNLNAIGGLQKPLGDKISIILSYYGIIAVRFMLFYCKYMRDDDVFNASRMITYKLRLYRLYFPPLPVLAFFQRLWRGRRSAYNLWYHYVSYNTYIIIQCDSPFTWHAQSNCFLQIVIFGNFKYMKGQYFQILGFFIIRFASLKWYEKYYVFENTVFQVYLSI